MIQIFHFLTVFTVFVYEINTASVSIRDFFHYIKTFKYIEFQNEGILGTNDLDLWLYCYVYRTFRLKPCWSEPVSRSSRATAALVLTTHLIIPFISVTLNSSCRSIFSQDVADNQVDTGNLLECLVQNKHQREMNEKCAVGVTHFQLVSQSHNQFPCVQ